MNAETINPSEQIQIENEQQLESAFHEYAFTVDGMAAVLERLGFEVLQVRPYAALDTLMRYGAWRVPQTLMWEATIVVG